MDIVWMKCGKIRARPLFDPNFADCRPRLEGCGQIFVDKQDLLCFLFVENGVDTVFCPQGCGIFFHKSIFSFRSEKTGICGFGAKAGEILSDTHVEKPVISTPFSTPCGK